MRRASDNKLRRAARSLLREAYDSNPAGLNAEMIASAFTEFNAEFDHDGDEWVAEEYDRDPRPIRSFAELDSWISRHLTQDDHDV